MMDRGSHLPDDLLLKILSFGSTKEVTITSVLSKRWRSLWMHVPKLDYGGCNYQNKKESSFSQFVSISLLLHKASFLESLHVSLHKGCSDTDIQQCLEIASNRNLRELKIDFGTFPRMGLPKRMCETLVVLHLCVVVLDVTLVPFSFTSLKTLHLVTIKYKGNNKGSFTRLLSKCRVLEDLYIKYHDNSQNFNITVPSLQRLFIRLSCSRCFRMKTPSLKHLKLESCMMKLCYIQHMPNIVTAHVEVFSTSPRKLPGVLTSVKRPSLCLMAHEGQVPRKSTKIFHQLLHLNLCTYYRDWPSYLKWMIEASPNLQSLKLHLHDQCTKPYVRPSDTNINNIPKCSLPHLETFEWLGYEGTPENRKLASYIFTNASSLKRAKFSSELTYSDKKKDKILKALMRKELSLLCRNSNTSCHISFD